MKFYRGSAAAARAYVEADHSRADDYYLTEGSGVATRYVADVSDSVSPTVRKASDLDGETYERWVAGSLMRAIAASPADFLMRSSSSAISSELTSGWPICEMTMPSTATKAVRPGARPSRAAAQVTEGRFKPV